jgi:uncharacterized phage-associated protein
MASAMDVANFFIEIFKDSEDPVTNLRIQKLLYFAQGWSLIRLKEPLFEDDTCAWQHGPVVPNVYHELSSYCKGPITSTQDSYSSTVFTTDQVTLLIDVAMKYRIYSTSKLVDMCHADGGAWKAIQKRNPPEQRIPIDAIREEFSKRGELKSFNVDAALRKMAAIGYRDSEGCLVLPKELNE